MRTPEDRGKAAALLASGKVSACLPEQYSGDLRKLRERAGQDPEETQRLLREIPGIGSVGADIFLRGAQGVRPKAAPYFDGKAVQGAARLGLPDSPRTGPARGPRRPSRPRRRSGALGTRQARTRRHHRTRRRPLTKERVLAPGNRGPARSRPADVDSGRVPPAGTHVPFRHPQRGVGQVGVAVGDHVTGRTATTERAITAPPAEPSLHPGRFRVERERDRDRDR
jgi:hypothetical protein